MRGNKIVDLLNNATWPKIYIVAVPHPQRNYDVVYPATGFPLYTRTEAIDVLRKFAERGNLRVRAVSSWDEFKIEELT